MADQQTHPELSSKEDENHKRKQNAEDQDHEANKKQRTDRKGKEIMETSKGKVEVDKGKSIVIVKMGKGVLEADMEAWTVKMTIGKSITTFDVDQGKMIKKESIEEEFVDPSDDNGSEFEEDEDTFHMDRVHRSPENSDY